MLNLQKETFAHGLPFAFFHRMDSQELLNSIFRADHPAFREVVIHDPPILLLDVPVPSHILNRKRKTITCNTACIMDATKQRMSRRGAISYGEDHDVARFVRGHSKYLPARPR